METKRKRERLLKFLTQGLIPRKFSTHNKFTVSNDQEHSWGPAGFPEGKEKSCQPPQYDRGPENTGTQALLEEAEPSVNFLESQFAHHQRHITP